MTARRRTLLLAAGLALFAGCTSIPLGTLLSMRDFDPADPGAIDAGELRLAVLVEPPPLRADAARSRLVLTLTPRGGGPPQRHVFGLRAARVYDARLVPGRDPRWQVLELDPDGREALRRVQPVLETAEEHYRRWEFSFSMQLSGEPPPGIDAAIASVRLQLTRSKPPLLLFDRARIATDGAGR